jgi:sodium-dependent phosphate cotransporter
MASAKTSLNTLVASLNDHSALCDIFVEPQVELQSVTQTAAPAVASAETDTPARVEKTTEELKVEKPEQVEQDKDGQDEGAESEPMDPKMVAVKCFMLAFFLYFFLFSLDLMGTSFKVLGGCTAGQLFGNINNPIAGLMIGILATVLVQSSSTSTSIVVALVGAGALSVQNAVPVIMGANIGTSVTNTLVALGHLGQEDELERAFAGATVHDMFNFLAVGVFLPLEIVTHMIQALSEALTSGVEVEDGEAWEGPIKLIVAPLVHEFLSANKDVIKQVAQGESTCDAFYALNETTGRRAQDGLITCKDDVCGLFYSATSTEAEDTVAAAVCLFISLVILVSCLLGLVTTLNSLVASMSEKWIKKAVNINPYVAMLVGAGVTVLVQSSSITTSVLTPLVGMGLINLEQMYPLTLGANVGTTATALLASLVSDKIDSVQIAICHLVFNLFGILLFYPIPYFRQLPLQLATKLGRMTKTWKGTPVAYIVLMFLIVPAILLGISSIFSAQSAAYDALGIILVLGLCLWSCYFAHWWYRRDGDVIFFNWLRDRQHRSDVFDDVPMRWKTLVKDVEEMRSLLREKMQSDQK